MASSRCGRSAAELVDRVLSFSFIELARPRLETNRSTRLLTLWWVTSTVKVVEAVATFPARSVAVALMVLLPSAKV